jgi:hypothetical protein
MIQELQSLLEFTELLGLGEFPTVDSNLIMAMESFQAGSYEEARDRLVEARLGAYAQMVDVIRPMVEEGLSDPRNSEIPLGLLRGLSNAELAFRDGKRVHGETYLFSALRDWSATVPEPLAALFVSTLVIVVILNRAQSLRKRVVFAER